MSREGEGERKINRWMHSSSPTSQFPSELVGGGGGGGGGREPDVMEREWGGAV